MDGGMEGGKAWREARRVWRQGVDGGKAWKEARHGGRQGMEGDKAWREGRQGWQGGKVSAARQYRCSWMRATRQGDEYGGRQGMV